MKSFWNWLKSLFGGGSGGSSTPGSIDAPLFTPHGNTWELYALPDARFNAAVAYLKSLKATAAFCLVFSEDGAFGSGRPHNFSADRINRFRARTKAMLKAGITPVWTLYPDDWSKDGSDNREWSMDTADILKFYDIIKDAPGLVCFSIESNERDSQGVMVEGWAAWHRDQTAKRKLPKRFIGAHLQDSARRLPHGLDFISMELGQHPDKGDALTAASVANQFSAFARRVAATGARACATEYNSRQSARYLEQREAIKKLGLWGRG